MAKYPNHLLQLIGYLKKLPGVGAKTAERFAFQIIQWPQDQLDLFGDALRTAKEKIKPCSECHCLMEKEGCPFCDPSRRDTRILCIISSAKDAYAFEETRSYKGLYHVLGGLLSPLDGRTPDKFNLDHLQKRIIERQIKEIILALDSTLEGDATALYLKEQLHRLGVNVSRLAFGLPMGSPLDFVDGGTLSRALTDRHSF